MWVEDNLRLICCIILKTVAGQVKIILCSRLTLDYNYQLPFLGLSKHSIPHIKLLGGGFA